MVRIFPLLAKEMGSERCGCVCFLQLSMSKCNAELWAMVKKIMDINSTNPREFEETAQQTKEVYEMSNLLPEGGFN